MTAFSSIVSDRPRWQSMIIFALGFWLSSSLILDLVIMPEMYVAGMMASPSFASAGYSIFWVFNRIELLCAAMVVSGALALYKVKVFSRPGLIWAVGLPLLLLTVALLYTYGMTPAMSALGIQLDWFNSTAEIPTEMDQLHQSYWMLELLKLISVGTLLNFYYRTQRA
jgi:hypothetical protein